MPAGTKRKSDAGAAGPSKKAREGGAHTAAIALAASILTDKANYALPDDDDTIIEDFVQLAQYARSLEDQIAQQASAPAAAAAQKSPEQMAEAVDKIRRAAVAGIKKQMSWKPSCKTGSAKWVYDGVCTDPNVFGALMGLNGPPTWKQKKLTVAEFENLFGPVEGSVRYNALYIRSANVNVRYSDGEFKLSGSYGI